MRIENGDPNAMRILFVCVFVFVFSNSCRESLETCLCLFYLQCVDIFQLYVGCLDVVSLVKLRVSNVYMLESHFEYLQS